MSQYPQGPATSQQALDQLAAELRATTDEKNLYLAAFESLPCPTFLLDRRMTVISLNHAAEALLTGNLIPAGASYYRRRGDAANLGEERGDHSQSKNAREFIGRDIRQLLPKLKKLLVSEATADNTPRRETKLLIHGQAYDLLVSQSPMQDASGKQRGSVVFLTDISDRKHMEDELRRLADLDPMTGARNRRYLEKVAKTELERARRNHTPLSVIAMDLDHFKNVNDSYGHAVGDQVLTEFAGICLSSIRRYDVFARVGGEEFVMLLPETTVAEAEDMAERLRVLVAEHQTQIDDGSITITTSLGVAAVDPSADHIDDMFLRADKALYRAKRAGRNRVEVDGTRGQAQAPGQGIPGESTG